MHQVTVREAKATLASLIEECLGGEEVVIAKNKRLLAKLTPIPARKRKRRLGGAKDLVLHMADDFNQPLDDFKDYMG